MPKKLCYHTASTPAEVGRFPVFLLVSAHLCDNSRGTEEAAARPVSPLFFFRAPLPVRPTGSIPDLSGSRGVTPRGFTDTARNTRTQHTHRAAYRERVHSVDTILPGFGKCCLKMLRHSAILRWAAEHFEIDSQNLAGILCRVHTLPPPPSSFAVLLLFWTCSKNRRTTREISNLVQSACADMSPKTKARLRELAPRPEAGSRNLAMPFSTCV